MQGITAGARRTLFEVSVVQLGAVGSLVHVWSSLISEMLQTAMNGLTFGRRFLVRVEGALFRDLSTRHVAVFGLRQTWYISQRRSLHRLRTYDSVVKLQHEI